MESLNFIKIKILAKYKTEWINTKCEKKADAEKVKRDILNKKKNNTVRT